MKLDRVTITNFRSIKRLSLSFSTSCRVLVGINESGKSNILEALSLLSSNYKIDKIRDKREELPDEKPIQESYVRFIFLPDKDEIEKIFEAATKKILSATQNPKILQQADKPIKLRDFCGRKELLYEAEIITERKHLTYFTLDDDCKIIAGWQKPSPQCPKDYVFEDKGIKYQLASYSLVRAADFPLIPTEYLDDATGMDVNTLVGRTLIGVLEDSLPEALLWEYQESYLLPKSIEIATFATTPNSCIPLKNMFILAGHTDIKNSLTEAKAGSPNQFKNFLDRIAAQATSHFRAVWKEYKDVKFSLTPDGTKILAGITEKNTHDFERRSDGFKRFIAFLLMISVNVKLNNLQNALILVDEPDISLHPSGSRFLRDELIRISKKNYVVFSTHSIFMIDRETLERHLIVKKENEITTATQAEVSNYSEEEVLYNALGYSMWEILKEDNNLIFEGYYDKLLFLSARGCAKAPATKKKLDKLGVCHAQGVGNMRNITPILELAGRPCTIISDHDEAALQQQRHYLAAKGYGQWKTYQNLSSEISAITAEDFIKNEAITRAVNTVINHLSMPSFQAAALPADSGKLKKITEWLKENGMNVGQTKDTIVKIKEEIFSNLKPKDIEDSYQFVLEGLI